MKVMVTGASGFIGVALLKGLANENRYDLVAALRHKEKCLPLGVDIVQVGDLASNIDWSMALEGVDVIVHAAARVHIMRDTVRDPLAEFRRINVDATLDFAHQAADAGVKRFIFLSSVKVNGEETLPGHSYTEESHPAPKDPYSISKYEAEQGLKTQALESGLEIVIIRLPLVYGPGVKGNFKSMMHLASKGIPLPFGAINNQRSLVAIDNLVDFIITCIDSSAAANQTFLVADGEDISTTELLRHFSSAKGKPTRLIPMPAGLVRLGVNLLGKKGISQRLFGSLQVDITKAREVLGWTPPVSVEEGLRRMIQGS